MKHLLLTTIAAVVLVGCGNAEADRALLDAAEKGNIKAVKQHLAAGADLNAKNDKLVYKGMTPLHFAVGKGHKEVAELLIAKGADVNAKADGGVTPLLWAASSGHKEIIELLIAEGADVNAKNGYEWTPLHRAASGGHKEIAEILIAKGADVNAKSDFGTPLDEAIRYKKTEIADLLRKHGGKTGAELKAEGK